MKKNHYKVVSARRQGLLRTKPTLLAPVPDASAVGGWLDEYRQKTNDRAFAGIEIHEVRFDQKPVVHNNPHRFIDQHLREVQRAELQLQIENSQLQQAA